MHRREETVFGRYMKRLDTQSRNVFGVGAKGALSAYSLFTALSIVLPLAALLILLIIRLF